jgi:hypothetical protein
VTKQSLNCLYVFALVDKEGREAVAEVVESECLPRSSEIPILRAAKRILFFAIMLALSGVLPFIFVDGKTQSSGFAYASAGVPPACHCVESAVILRV